MTNYEYIIQFFQHTNEHAFAEFLVVKIDDYNYTSNILFDNFTTRQEAINATAEKLKDTYDAYEFGLYDKIFKQTHPDYNYD